MDKKNTLRNYKNSVLIHFAERGENFTLKVPHHGKWIAIIKFLKKRGWNIGENPSYKEHYDCLSKYHKIGYKADVACLMEISNDSIIVEFGNIKNLWTGIAQSFWSNPTDERMAKLTYMESMRVKLEIYKLMKFCEKYNHELRREEENMKPEEYIVNSLKNNTHIHGIVTCLNDIKLDITPTNHNWHYNSNDKNKKKIICGETKYFYDSRTRRLSCGVVWHHINNMWWVITNGTLRNIAAFELFDFVKGLPKRKPLEKGEVERLLKKFESKRDYQRCIGISKVAESMVVAA